MKKILLDTDAGVDDILALLLLLRCPDLADVAGITMVAGNTRLPGCLANVQRGLHVAGLYTDGNTIDPRTIPLAMGAEKPLERELFAAEYVHGPDGLGGISLLRGGDGRPLYPEAGLPLDPRPAWEMILDVAEASPGEVTLVAIGPLTNLALAFRAAPDRFRGLREIILMGGAFRHEGNTSPRAEFNIFVDPEAAQIVLDSGVPVTVVPLDCSEQTSLRPDDMEGPGPVHQFVRDATAFILDFHERHEGFRGCFHHDPCAVAVALDKTFADGIFTRVVVERRGEHTTGETVADLRAERPLLHGPRNATVCLKPDAVRFETFVRERILTSGA